MAPGLNIVNDGDGDGIDAVTTDQFGAGVYGAGGNLGVYGKGPTGVYGSGSSTGVLGEGPHTGDPGTGVYGKGPTGVYGDGIPGEPGQPTTGVSGHGDTGVSGHGDTGVVGSGDFIGVHAVGNVGVYASAPGDFGVVVSAPGGWALLADGNVKIDGNVHIWGTLQVNGQPKSAVVKVPDGSHRVLYCVESPECWFEDFGRARLVRGRARVRLDRTFAAVVRTGDYHVFLSPEGLSHGLYVSRRTRDGFEVREHHRGTSTVAFSYRIAARRKDVDAPRFQRVKPPTPKLPRPPKVPKLPELPKMSRTPTPPRPSHLETPSGVRRSRRPSAAKRVRPRPRAR